MATTDDTSSERITQPEIANSRGALFADAYYNYRDSGTRRPEEVYIGGGRNYRRATEEEQVSHELNLSSLELIASSIEKSEGKKESEEQKHSKIFPKVDIQQLQGLTRKVRDEQDAYYDNLQEKAQKVERERNNERLLQLPNLAIESANKGNNSVDVLCLKQSPTGSDNTAPTSSDKKEISLTEEEQRISKAIEGMGFKTSIAMGYDDTIKSQDDPSLPPVAKKSCLVIRAQW